MKDYDPEAGLISFGSNRELPPRMNLAPDEFVSPKPTPAAFIGDELVVSDGLPWDRTFFVYDRNGFMYLLEDH